MRHGFLHGRGRCPTASTSEIRIWPRAAAGASIGPTRKCRCCANPGALRQGTTAGGHARRRLPARHGRDGQPDAHAAARRRRCGAVRLQPAVHAGRRGRLAGDPLRDPRLRHQGRGQRHLLQAHPRRARPQAADDDGRRRRPGQHAAQGPPRAAGRRASAARKRPRPASSACARWPPTGC